MWALLLWEEALSLLRLRPLLPLLLPGVCPCCGWL
jgi:hypothetical protein